MDRVVRIAIVTAGIALGVPRVALAERAARHAPTGVVQGLRRGLATAASHVVEFLPNVLVAVAILVIGWLLAKLVGVVVERRIAAWTPGRKSLEGDEERWKDAGRTTGRLVYWVAMLFVLMGFFWALRLDVATQPIRRLLDKVFGYLPHLVGAALILFASWIAALVVRGIVQRGAKRLRLDERLAKRLAKDDADRDAVAEEVRFLDGERVGQVSFWIVLLVGLLASLNALDLRGVMAPLQGMVARFLGYVPNLVASASALVLGVFCARIGRGALRGLLAASALDSWVRRRGLDEALGGRKPSQLLAQLFYVVALVPVLIAALGALRIESVSRPAMSVLQSALGAVPLAFAAAVTLAVTYVVARVLGDVTANGLAAVGFDLLPTKLGFDREKLSSLKLAPSTVVGRVVLSGVMIFAGMEAARLLGFAGVAALLQEFLVFGGGVLLGLLILAIGLYVAQLARELVTSSFGAKRGRGLGRATQFGIVLLSVALALPRLGVPTRMVLVVFGIPLFGVALALAVAFGMGGRDLASRYLETWFHPADLPFAGPQETELTWTDEPPAPTGPVIPPLPK